MWPAPERLPVNQGYILSNGNVEPSNLPIQQLNDSVYVLTGDIVNYTLKIERSNFTLDGKGYGMPIPLYGEKDSTGQTKSVLPLLEIRDLANITIQNFKFTNNPMPISAVNCTSVSIIGNTITNCNWIYLRYCKQCVIQENILNHNMYGLYGYDNERFDIKYNQICYNSWHGIILEFLNNSTIIGNVFSGNAGRGICYLGTNNRVIGNIFQNNEGGILSYVEGNEIHHNNFINNICDHKDSGIAINAPNTLDDGKEGNYWSSHPQTEPLTIPSVFISDNQTNVDHHPRLVPYVFDYKPPTITISSPIPQSNFKVDDIVTLNFNASKTYTRAFYCIDGAERVHIKNSSISIASVPLGTHQLTVYAEDAFGNEGASSIFFTIAQSSVSSTFPIEASQELISSVLLAFVAFSIVVLSFLILRKVRKK